MNKCGSCRFFVLLPKQTVDLSEPSQGQCRSMPPSCGLMLTPQGPVKFTDYPQMSPEFPACSLHDPVLKLDG